MNQYKLTSAVLSALKLAPDNKKQLIVGVSVAKTAAYSLPLPSAPVEDVLGFYADNCADAVNSIIAEVNEVVLVNDFSFSQYLARAFWMLRYRLVHDARRYDTIRLVDTLAGLDERLMAPAVREQLNDLASNDVAAVCEAIGDAMNAAAVAVPVAAPTEY